MERMVKESLKKEGIMIGVEPVVELSKKANGNWIGTAAYGEIIYDLSVYKDWDGNWRIKRQRR
jgi:hypothetical protein